MQSSRQTPTRLMALMLFFSCLGCLLPSCTLVGGGVGLAVGAAQNDRAKHRYEEAYTEREYQMYLRRKAWREKRAREDAERGIQRPPASIAEIYREIPVLPPVQREAPVESMGYALLGAGLGAVVDMALLSLAVSQVFDEPVRFDSYH